MMVKHEIPKGGGTCFICKEKCEVYWYWHPACKEEWMDKGKREK